MGRSKDILAGYSRAKVSDVFQHVPRLGRLLVGLTEPEDALLHWHMSQGVYPDRDPAGRPHPQWGVIETAKKTQYTAADEYHEGVLATEAAPLNKLIASGGRLALARRVGSVVMVGVSEHAPYCDDFLRPLENYPTKVGVIVRAVDGRYDGSIGVVDHRTMAFDPLPTMALTTREVGATDHLLRV